MTSDGMVAPMLRSLLVRGSPHMIPTGLYGNFANAGRVPVVVRKLKRSTGVTIDRPAHPVMLASPAGLRDAA